MNRILAFTAALLIAGPAFAGPPAASQSVTTAVINNAGGQLVLRDALQTLAARADSGNLITNPVSSSAATLATPSSPSTTGMTNLLPQTAGFASSLNFSTVSGSNVLTYVSYSQGGGFSSLQVGMPVAELGSNAAFPADIPPNSIITSINSGASTITISNNATATISSTTIAFFPATIAIVGGYAASYNTIMAAGAGTCGNGVSPPTAQTYCYTPYAFEFMTDAANFNTGSYQLLYRNSINGKSPDAVRVAIDDVYQTSNLLTYAGSSGNLTIQLTNPGVHKVRIESQSGALTTNLWITTGAQVWKPPIKGPNPSVVVVTDSFGQGGASGSWNPDNAFFQFCILNGLNCNQANVGGTGYENNGSSNYNWLSSYRIADITRFSPDLIIFAGSVNDSGYTPSTWANSYVLPTLQAARSANPKATEIVFGVTATVTVSLATCQAMESAEASAIAGWADPNVFFIPECSDPAGAWINPSTNTNFSGGGYINYASFTASAATTVLTVTAVATGTILPGQTVSGASVSGSPAVIFNGSGTGGTGTYGLSVSQSTIGSESMTSGDSTHPSDFIGTVNATLTANGTSYLANKMTRAYRAVLPSIPR